MQEFLPNTVPDEEMQYIDKWLDSGIDQGVEIEMIYFALLAMKKNPKLSIIEALLEGFNEWVK
jgi:hypothetical protein